jgi:4-amino-4-deoxy-L-arabinose transferase-like glycosyltransferase
VAIGGEDERTVRLLPVPLVLATTVLVGLVARRLRGDAAGLIAATLFALLSTDPFLYGESANMEHMVNLFAFGSLALVVAAWNRTGRVLLVAAGASVGAAFLVKQTAALHGPVFALALLLRRQVPAAEGTVDRPLRSRLLDVAALALGFVLATGLAVLAVAAQGAAGQAYDDIVRYGGALAAETPSPPGAPPFWLRWITGNADPRGILPWPFGSTDYLVWWGTGTWPVWLAAVAALAWLLLARGTDGPRRLVAFWTLSAWVQVALPRLFWQHYYLLPVPGIAVVVAVFLVDQVALTRLRGVRRLVHGLVAVAVIAAIAWTVRLQVVEYLLVPPQDLVRDRGGRQWIVDRALGRELRRRSVVFDHPTLFVWGWQGPLYFYSGLDGVTPQVFVDDFLRSFAGTDHPLVRPRIERTMRDLRARPPSLVFTGYPPFPALRAFLDERYIPSRIAPGLWVEQGRHGAFENFVAQ